MKSLFQHVVLLSFGILLALFALPLSMPAQDAWAPDSKIGNFQFNMPKGWKRLDKAGSPELVPADLQNGTITLIDFLPSQPLNGRDLRSWFSAAWTEWQKQFRVVDGGQITSGHSPNGFDFLRLEARVSGPQIGFASFVFSAAKIGDRAEAYYFLNNGSYYVAHDALQDFEHSLRFANNPAAPARERQPSAAAAGAAGGLQGLYIGYKMRGLIGLNAHFDYFVFLPDGNVVRYLPEHGLENFDFRTALRDSRDYCGRYRATANQVEMAWADNNTEVAKRDGTSLKLSGDQYFPVSNPNGLKLQGTFRREGADLARYALQFAPDGTFRENGMLTLLAYEGKDSRPGSGTYKIGDYSLKLFYQDGRRITFSFFIFPEVPAGQRPTRIHVNTYALVAGR